MIKDHHCFETEKGGANRVIEKIIVLGYQSKCLTTSCMLRLFSGGIRAPKKDERVVYMNGAWYMFNCGHVAILK